MSKRSRVLAAGLAAAVLVTVLAVPSSLEAASITIYTAPDRTYQNTLNNPCIFYGPGECSNPEGFDFTGPTNNEVSGTLVQSYSLTTFTSVVTGGSFVVGLDINDANKNQTFSVFTIDFLDTSNVALSPSFVFSPAQALPNLANGSGYADYILAEGCSVTPTAQDGVDACSQYNPFDIPIGTASVRFTFSFLGTGNDGPDKLFLIPTTGVIPPPDPAPVPEPGSLVLLGSGLALAARSLRRQRLAAQKPASQLSDLHVVPEPQALPRLRKPRGARLAETQPQTKH